MGLSISSTKKLNNGNEIPILGLGTYQMHESSEAAPAVIAALQAGYRHIDTAQMYENEAAIGKAISESGIPRKDIFITTKVYDANIKNQKAALNTSLDNLMVDYVDLYLVHWPIDSRINLWRQLEGLQSQGLCKNIGVSNFTINHLEHLLANCSIVPQVNQVEFSPFLYQKDLLDYCTIKGIVLEAYAPLTRAHKLDNPTLEQIASVNNKSAAQILVRWSLQHGLVTLPKSKLTKRIVENANVFDFNLSHQQMLEIDSLNTDERFCWDPSLVA